MNIPFLDLSEEFNSLHEEWFNAIKEVGANGRYILGPNVQAFEEECAAYVGTDYAVSVANGTDALTLSLRALNIGAGDEVITSPFTFFASSECIDLVGATPVFADIDEQSFNITADSIEAVITDKTKAIIVVHIFGQPADMTAINALAAKHNLEVLEDAAQAFGAQVGDQRVGSLGSTGCFSFYPTKVLGCYGDGGIITTNSKDVLDRLHRLRNHGAIKPFVHAEVGYNSRLDEIQAAILRLKLKKIDADIAARNRIAAAYSEQLKDSGIITPYAPPGFGHAFNLYTIRLTENRDAVRQILTDNGIPSSQCYPEPLSVQPVYQSLGYKKEDVPVCEMLTHQTLSLPVYPAMTDEMVEHITSTLIKAVS
ncbi:MAG: DegT/DnrJ/EryC1/StrS family aminotransferase [Gammaproteobacteria bacterium]|nr:DegT/DnrJ/EryC1/StrS family aminotransferase [Gammaproteobacteria bacterium]